MNMRLYMDEDSMDQRLVRALRARKVDVKPPLEAGMVERSDEAHLVYAAQEGRVLYSFNVQDFYQLHTLFLNGDRPHAGLILAPQQRYTVGAQMRRLLRLGEHFSAEEMRNHVVFLSNIAG